MSRGINKVILVGNLGADPETRGSACKLRIATAESWTDKATGDKQERTEWHRVTAFGKLGEVCQRYLTKGRQVYIEGSLRTSKYTDSSGVEKYSTEIIASEMQMLGGKGEEGASSSAAAYADASGASAAVARPKREQPAAGPDFDDEIPF